MHSVMSSVSRRHFLLTGAAALSVSVLPLGRAFAAQEEGSTPQNVITTDAALQRLMEGNARYVSNISKHKDFSAGRAARAKAQHPIAAILACADSCVAPELMFDQGPGDLFLVRLAGNFVNEDGLASLEYAIQFLSVPLVMILGHSNCGAIKAALQVIQENTALPGHLPHLIQSLKPAVRNVKKTDPSAPDLVERAIVENVRLNAQRLKTAEPVFKRFVQQGKVKVVGAVYDIGTGKVNLMDAAAHQRPSSCWAICRASIVLHAQTPVQIFVLLENRRAQRLPFFISPPCRAIQRVDG